jgi:hypothetical protein
MDEVFEARENKHDPQKHQKALTSLPQKTTDEEFRLKH